MKSDIFISNIVYVVKKPFTSLQRMHEIDGIVKGLQRIHEIDRSDL